MEKRTIRLIPLLFISVVGYVLLHFYCRRADFYKLPQNTDFIYPLSIFAALFFLFVIIWKQSIRPEQVRIALVIAILIRVILIFSIPNFSDDFYRFLWDGYLGHEGINPFHSTPAELMAGGGAMLRGDLFAAMNSAQYHSVYPPLLQILFTASWKLSEGNLNESVLTLKFFIFLAEAGSLFFLFQLCKKLGYPLRNVLLYALNPLVIFELSGNLHFEAIMIFCLLAAIWHFSELKFIPTAIFLGIGVSIKLLPAILFPFFIRRIGIAKTILLASITALIFLLLFLPWYYPGVIKDFFLGLKLYFSHFEFNASFYYLGKWILGWESKKWLPFILSCITVGIIIYAAMREKKPGIKNLPVMFLFAFTIYFLNATTVHPWYLTTLIALCAISNYRFPVFWSFLMILTYFTYYNGYLESTMLIQIEYCFVFGWIFLEWQFFSTGFTLEERLLQSRLFKNLYRRSIPARMKIKKSRILNHLDKRGKILDLGTGNGGLCHELIKEGFDVLPIDVKDQSFFPNVIPMIYDGKKLPFEDKSFDIALLVTVLHHVKTPSAILGEAKRVATKKIIVMEDIYSNVIQKYFTFFIDSLVNMEFSGHPHSNKTDLAWRAEFERQGLSVLHVEKFRTLLFFTQIIYVLEPYE